MRNKSAKLPNEEVKIAGVSRMTNKERQLFFKEKYKNSLQALSKGSKESDLEDKKPS